MTNFAPSSIFFARKHFPLAFNEVVPTIHKLEGPGLKAFSNKMAPKDPYF
jgi:hypothetical protein